MFLDVTFVGLIGGDSVCLRKGGSYEHISLITNILF